MTLFNIGYLLAFLNSDGCPTMVTIVFNFLLSLAFYSNIITQIKSSPFSISISKGQHGQRQH